MTTGIAPIGLDPQRRAELIYAQARAELDPHLWQATLGAPSARGVADVSSSASFGGALRKLVSTLEHHVLDASRPTLPPPPVAPSAVKWSERDDDRRRQRRPPTSPGANAEYDGAIGAAAQRTGLAAPVLTAIIGAEAAVGPDGRWQPLSRNPRSSAAGLGQFLTGTWISEAQRPGTWLHGIAQARNWLNAQGHILPDARTALLALRYDGAASIHAIADYAQHNLATLRSAGIHIGDTLQAQVRLAYMGHHLGAGDAIRFLAGRLDSARARTLLTAQIGAAATERHIAAAGDSIRAHHRWLTSFIDHAVKAVGEAVF